MMSAEGLIKRAQGNLSYRKFRVLDTVLSKVRQDSILSLYLFPNIQRQGPLIKYG